MKVLLTGGAGYIGYSLVEKLAKHSEIEEIIIYDTLSHHDINFFFIGNKLPQCTFIKADILNNYELNKAVEQADCVIHLAAEVRFPYSHEDHAKYEQVNQYGTLNLYQAIENHPVQKVIYLSSAAVYGFQKVDNEKVAPRPENAYGKSKWEGEKYLQNIQNADLYVLRSANVFGPNPCMRKDSVINKFILDALLYKRIMIDGNGDQKRAFIHIDSLIHSIMEAFTGTLKPGIYNLVEANGNMNEIRDILLEENPNLEFTYISSTSDFKSVEMYSSHPFERNSLDFNIRKSYRQLKQMYRLH